MMQVAGKENTKSNKDYERFDSQLHYKGICLRDPWKSPADPHISTEHGSNISDMYIPRMYVMATEWFYCALLNSVARRSKI
jgi:hypothetical protein